MNLMYASGVDGLVGSMTDGGYGFAMNTFLQASIILPPVRYDDRYTRAIGNIKNVVFKLRYDICDIKNKEMFNNVFDIINAFFK